MSLLVGQIKAGLWVKRILLASVILVVLYTFSGFVAFPWAVKRVATKKLAETLHRPVQIEKVRFNPYSLILQIDGLVIREPDRSADFVSFQSLLINLQASSVLRLAPEVKELTLQKPFVRIVRNQDRSYNFSDLLAPSKAEKSPAPASTETPGLPKFRIHAIRIEAGGGDFIDHHAKQTHALRELSLAIPLVSTIGKDVEEYVQPSFSCLVDGRTVALEGKTKPFTDPLETVFTLSLEQVDLPACFAYLPPGLPVRLVSGSLSATLHETYVQPREKDPTFSLSGDVALQNIAVVDKAGQPFFTMESLKVAIAPSAPLLEHRLHLASAEIQSPDLTIVRAAAGTTNLSSLASPAESEPADEAQPPEGKPYLFTLDRLNINQAAVRLKDLVASADAESTSIFILPKLTAAGVTLEAGKRSLAVEEISAEGGDCSIERLPSGELNLQTVVPAAPAEIEEVSAPADPASPTWAVSLRKLGLKQFTVHGRNLAPEQRESLILGNLDFNLEDFSSLADHRSPISLSCSVNETGSLRVEGECGFKPISADLTVAAEKLKIIWAQPFFTEAVGIRIAKGEVFTTGALSLFIPPEAELQGGFQGSIQIQDLATVTKGSSDNFVSWKQLGVEDIKATFAPLSLNVQKVSFQDLIARIIVNPDSSLNMQKVVVTSGARPAPDAQTNAAGVPAAEGTSQTSVAVNTIAFKKGKILFDDRSIAPPFSASIESINGTVKGLATESTRTADINVEALLNGYAPLSIKGSLAPMSNALSLDLQVRLDDYEVGPLSPYSGKYVGHTIQEGKLGLDLQYRIKDNTLTAANNVLMDQFNFGEQVESPDDLKLPVKLAVTLLKDRSGTITLDLPVSGRLDDPQFSLRKTILNVIKNLLVKATTAPFSLITGAFSGGKEDPSYIEFEPGSAVLTEVSIKKLETLGAALKERPGVRLHITGYVDAQQDPEGLVVERINAQIKAQKVEELLKRAGSETELNEVEVLPDERDRYLKKAYKEADFDKPKNLVGLTKDIPPAEMEALMRKNSSITEEDLQTLAQERGHAVLNFLTGTGAVEADRLFLKKAESLTPEAIDTVKASRVNLKPG
ncbi:MAG TPA: DUF748 domain-containing protein [Thermodesulfobacteriota bacterium]|nr:DUF748 domain-containing protein [Thermodesulfobacteriota bacterium]